MFLYHEPQGNHARSGKKKGLMAHGVLCSLYKKKIKKCKLKFCSMFLVIRKPGGNLQPAPAKEIAH